MSTVVLACADEPIILHKGSDVVAITGLCERPAQLATKVEDGTSVVLLLHPARYDLVGIQKALRSVDIDPLGVQILEVPVDSGGADLEIAVVGLRQRALAYAGSRPEHAKPVLRGEVTRRELFKIPQPVYLAAPMVDHAVCAAIDGCRACVDVCPQDAYKWHQGRVHFDKDICEPCGRCVSTCPTEAISNPAATPTMLAAQIGALIERSDVPVGIRFVCSRAHPTSPVSAWYDVVVPCTGMIPGSWLITALLLGAGSVTAAACSETGCPLELDDASRVAVDFARTALAAAGSDPESVAIEAGGGAIKSPMARADLKNPFTRAADVAAMLALDSRSDGRLSVSHPGSSLGVVDIDADACTLCAQCAQTCPTDAITAGYKGESVSLSFDASLCTNCTQCTIACPEIERGAIRVAGRVDAELLVAGRRTINEGTVLVCESCGKPIAPSSMMDRIGQLLGDDFDDTMSYLTRRCVDCRGLA